MLSNHSHKPLAAFLTLHVSGLFALSGLGLPIPHPQAPLPSLVATGLFSVSVLSQLSHVRPFATPWTVAQQAPLFMGFSRQEYWSGLPFLSPGDLPYPGIEVRSPTLQADALTSKPPGSLTITCLPVHFSILCLISVSISCLISKRMILFA